MTESVLIRALGLSDLDALLALYTHLHTRDEAPAARHQLEAIWARICQDPAQAYWGAFRAGELVSAANVTIVPNLTRAGRPYALIENVVTHTEHRRQGIGSRLLHALLEHCWAEGCYKVMLMSAAGRAEAHHFYAALGFDGSSKQAFVISRR